MVVNSSDSRLSLWVRILRRVLMGRGSQVQAMEEALRLRRLTRFIGLVAAMILMPSLLLAYFGIRSIEGEEMAIMEDVENQAEGAGEAFWSQYERSFTAFESGVRTRLEAGRSPLESAQELHPHLLVGLKLDTNLEVRAPFFRSGRVAPEPIGFLFDEAPMKAMAAERRGEDVGVVARLYGNAARQARSRQARARLLFDRARVLAAKGRTAEASGTWGLLEARYQQVRDPWGFRMQDLVALENAERVLSQSGDYGPLRALVGELLDTRWTIGEGGEGAIARRALARLEPYADAEWVAATRGRIDARTRMLYWTDQLLPELDSFLAGGNALRVDEGKMRWVAGERGLWAITWWSDKLYAFALDRSGVIDEVVTFANEVTQPQAPIVGRILSPNASRTPQVLARRSLAPWLTGWSLVVAPRDAVALAADQQTRRNQRIVIITLAVVMIVVGALASGRLVSNELGHARMKADFAANVSHELRSPITQIRLKAESLLLGLSETDEEKHHDYRTIVRESERLSHLVDNVLDFSAIERGAKRYHITPGAMGETVQLAIDSIESSAELEDRTMTIDIQSDLPFVDHDPDAVAQCVINLVSNAAKYSDAEDLIEVSVRPERGGVAIAVRDHGIGIPPDDLRQIFEPFYRGDAAAVRRRKGTGIGLAITFYIVQEHRGRIDVVSTPSQGSTFSMWFPPTDSGVPTA